ncbi:MAG: thiamine diphosphokinase [Bacteroidetes bacterium]|nr:thiamine diphosphokinase [Bacteroidota bacterium]
MKKCIILANGKSPRKSVITFFQKNGFDTIICADGGADSALRLGLTPDFIIGDLDSISKEAIKKFKSTSKILQYKRQNDTDVEKCLKFAIKNKFDEALLIGVTGNRLDHTICNLGIVLKFFSKIKLSLVAENSYLKPYTGDFRLKTQKGEIISLYGFDKKTKITSKGLKYSLKNISLPFGEKESTSNISTSGIVQLKIKNGIIFVIRDFNFIKKYDLFQFD